MYVPYPAFAAHLSATHFLCAAVLISYSAIELKRKWQFLTDRLDDTLDVFTCHGLGGITGALMTGLFANNQINPYIGENEGAFYGNPRQLWVQLVSVLVAMSYSSVGTLVILFILKYTPRVGLRTQWQEEELGDVALHREVGYSPEMLYPKARETGETVKVV